MTRKMSKVLSPFLSRLINALSPYIGENQELADLLAEAIALKSDLQEESMLDEEAAYFRLELKRLLREQKLQHAPEAEKAALTLDSVFAQLAMQERHG